MVNLIVLTRDNLHELESIERLAAFLGAARFGTLALQLAYKYPVKTDEPYLSIRRMHHSSVIGMSDAPFEVLPSLKVRTLPGVTRCESPQLLPRLSCWLCVW